MPKVHRFLAASALLFAASLSAETVAPSEPVEIAESARVAAGLFPAAPASDEAYAELIKSAAASGVSAQRLLESEIYRALMHRVKTSDCEALAARLGKVAKDWKSEDAVLIDSPVLADALVHALRARHALLAGNDLAKFRSEAAEAVWRSTRLADLIAEIETERSRETLLATAAFKALGKAAASGDEAAARKAFDEAFWASPPLSCDLAVEKIDGMRDAREEAKEKASKPEAPAKGVAAFIPARRDRLPWHGHPARASVAR